MQGSCTVLIHVHVLGVGAACCAVLTCTAGLCMWLAQDSLLSTEAEVPLPLFCAAGESRGAQIKLCCSSCSDLSGCSCECRSSLLALQLFALLALSACAASCRAFCRWLCWLCCSIFGGCC